MSVKSGKLTAAVAAIALCASSSGAAAASTPSPTSNPWVALSMLDSTAAHAMAAAQEEGSGAEAAAARPPFLPLAVIAATLATAFWIIVRDNPDRPKPEENPESPN